MSELNLPLHPTARDPRTGEPIRAVHIDRNGTARWPCMGGSQDPNPTPDPTPDPKPDPDPTPDPKPDPTPDPKPDPDPEPDKDLGFPKDTRVEEMKPAEQAAYWRHQARKHEGRATAYRTAAGGKTAEELKTERDEAARAAMTAQERAVDDAKRAAREEAAREFGPKAVRSAFELVLGDLPEKDRDEFIGDLDLSKFLTESGDVDTGKVLKRAETIGRQGTRLDFGGGPRGTSQPRGGGVAAVMAERRAAREAKQKQTNS